MDELHFAVILFDNDGSYVNVYSTAQSGDEIYLVEFGYRKSESRPSVIMFVNNNKSNEYIFYEY